MRTIASGRARLALASALVAVFVLAIAGSAAAVAPPEFVECVKAHESGAFTDKGCTLESSSHTGKYEATPAASGKTVSFKLEGWWTFVTGENEVHCTKGKGTGQVAGAQTLSGVVYTLTGCVDYTGVSCHASGAGAGIVRTSPLEGELGIIDSPTNTFGIEFAAPKGTSVTTLDCGSAAPIELVGAVLGRFKHSAPFVKDASFSLEAGEGFEEFRFEGGPRIMLDELEFEGDQEILGEAFLGGRSSMKFGKLTIEP
jgi:hypothetical protein